MALKLFYKIKNVTRVELQEGTIESPTFVLRKLPETTEFSFQYELDEVPSVILQSPYFQNIY